MKIQLKRSNVLENGVAKEPTAGQMEYGELAVNYNENDISIFTKDSDNNIRRVGGSVNKGSGEPGDPGTTPGDWYFDITNNILYYWDGSGWEEVQAVSKLIGGDGIEITTATTGTTFTVDLAGGDDGLEFDGGKLKATIASSSEYGVVKIGNGLDGGSDGIIKARNTITVGEDPPATNLNQGDLWWNSGEDSGRLYVYYEDENTQQWIDASPQGGNLEQDQADQLYLSKKNDDTAVGNITFTKKIFVDEAVGIGTTSPAEKLTLVNQKGSNVYSFGSYFVGNGDAGSTNSIHLGCASNSSRGILISATKPAADNKHDLIFSTSRGNTVPEEAMRIAASGNVGIGTDAPNVRLQVTGPSSTLAIDDTTTKVPMLRFRDNGTTIGRIYMSNDDMRFDTSGTTERVRIKENGYVGINNSNPQAFLQVGGATTAGVPTLFLSRSPSVGNTSDIALTANAVIRSESSIRNVVNDGGIFTWLIGGNDNKAGTAGSSEVMRISTTGNVGIGNTAPATKLNVLGSANYNPVANPTQSDFDVRFTSGTASLSFGQAAGTPVIQGSGSGTSYNLCMNPYIGNVAIGTNVPDTKLTVGGTDAALKVNNSTSGANVWAMISNPGGDDSKAFVFTSRGGASSLGGYSFESTDGSTTNTNMVIRASGNVGIGTTNPQSGRGPLHLHTTTNTCNIHLTNNDSGAGSQDGLTLFMEGSTSAGVWYREEGAFRFATNNAERMRVDSSGRLLIGTTSAVPSGNNPDGNRLCLLGAQTIFRSSDNNIANYLEFVKQRGEGVAVQKHDNLGQIVFEGSDGTNPLRAASIHGAVDEVPGVDEMPGRLVFSTSADGGKSPQERMRICHNGNIGINNDGINLNDNLTVGAIVNDVVTQRYISVRGRTTPTAVDISAYACLGWGGQNGDAAYTTNSLTGYSVQAYAPGANQTVEDAYGFFVSSGFNVATNNYSFNANLQAGAGRWNFYANGTASNYFAGHVLLHNTDESNITSGSVNAKGFFDSCVLRSSRNSTSTLAHAVFYNPNGGVGSIQTDGSSTLYNTSSDYRLKENITPIVGAADRVKALKPCRFNFKADADKTIDGFLAHEAQTVVPEAVTGTKDETEAIGVLFDWDDTVLERGVTEPEELTYTEEVTTPAVQAQEATYDEDGNELTPAVEAVDEVTTTVVRTMRWEKFGDRAVMQGIDQSKLVPLLTAALQEALERIEQLESKVSAL